MKVGYTQAEVYLYNQGFEDAPLIRWGDYRRQVELHLNEETYYIAYGSNLDQARLEERVGPVKVFAKGHLEGFSLVFNKRNPDGSASANLRNAGNEARVPFVAYFLPKGMAQLDELDLFECVPGCYRRFCFPFSISPGGSSILVSRLSVQNDR